MEQEWDQESVQACGGGGGHELIEIQNEALLEEEVWEVLYISGIC